MSDNVQKVLGKGGGNNAKINENISLFDVFCQILAISLFQELIIGGNNYDSMVLYIVVFFVEFFSPSLYTVCIIWCIIGFIKTLAKKQ